MSLRRAALAGLGGGLGLALTEGLLRLVGVSLPAELFADRFLPLLPVQVFIFMIGHLGGPVMAKEMALFGGFVGAAAAGAAAGALYVRLLRLPGPARHPQLTLGIGVLVVWLGSLLILGPVLEASYIGLPPEAATVVTALSLLLQFVVYAVILLAALAALRPSAAEAASQAGRRTFLLGAAGALMAVATGGFAAAFYRASTLGYDGMSLPGPVDRITPADRFYVVTKNLIDPGVDGGRWRLEVAGRVLRPATYTMDQLMAMPGAVDQETTLECISNEVGRGLMSNAVWHGLRLRDVLEGAGLEKEAVGIAFQAVDGYVHTTSLAMAMDDLTMLAWQINGQPLPDHHGYPLRLLVPSGYGEISVKWLTRIEALDHSAKGYYESQGWQASFVQTTARIDVPALGDSVKAGQPVTMRGIAYGAERGISRAEISADGGSSWQAVSLESGRPGTWYLWSHVWTPTGQGQRKLMARAYDGEGKLQKETYMPSVPRGTSGVHTITVNVQP